MTGDMRQKLNMASQSFSTKNIATFIWELNRKRWSMNGNVVFFIISFKTCLMCSYESVVICYLKPYVPAMIHVICIQIPVMIYR